MRICGHLWASMGVYGRLWEAAKPGSFEIFGFWESPEASEGRGVGGGGGVVVSGGACGWAHAPIDSTGLRGLLWVRVVLCETAQHSLRWGRRRRRSRSRRRRR